MRQHDTLRAPQGYWDGPAEEGLLRLTPAVRQPGAGLTHEVQVGETLFSIARKYYGDGTRWRVIQQANAEQLDDPSQLRVGMMLQISGP